MSMNNISFNIDQLSKVLKDNDGGNKIDENIKKFISMVNNKIDTVDKLAKPTDLRISTKSAAARLTCVININEMAKMIKDIMMKDEDNRFLKIETKKFSYSKIDTKKKPKKDKVTFYNQATVVIEAGKKKRKVNIKFFSNGSISMTGCEDDTDGVEAVNTLLTTIKKNKKIFDSKYDMNHIKMVNYRITMINTDYVVGYKVNRENVYNLIKKKYKVFVEFDSDRYPGVKIGYMWNENNSLEDGLCYCDEKCKYEKKHRKNNKCKLVTIALFQSGKIIITGANNIIQTQEAYRYINKILYDNENYKKIVRFSIYDV